MNSAAALKAWIFRHAPKARPAGREIQFPCLTCGHKAHYFNPHKGLGFCHAASCQRVSTVRSLEEEWGEFGDYTVGAQEPVEVPVDVVLPKGCKPLVSKDDGILMTFFPEAVAALKDRHLSADDAWLFDFQMDVEDDRLVVPVIHNNKLVNYVSRAAWWYTGKTDEKRYMYAKGANTSDYLFNFRMVPQGAHLAIVENTFNAIWLRRYFPCTTAFGSHLSNAQIVQIKERCSYVTLMWDHGAEDRAKTICQKLRMNYVPANYVVFTPEAKQPDNYPLLALYDAYKRAAALLPTAPYWEGGVPIGKDSA